MSASEFITPGGTNLGPAIHQFMVEYPELVALMVKVETVNPEAESFRKFRSVLNAQLCKAILNITPHDRMANYRHYAGQIISMSAPNLFNAVVTNDRVSAFINSAKQVHHYLENSK